MKLCVSSKVLRALVVFCGVLSSGLSLGADGIVVTPDVLLGHVRRGGPELAALPGVTWTNNGRRLIFSAARDGGGDAGDGSDEDGAIAERYAITSIDIESGKTVEVGAGYRAVAARRGDTIAFVSHGSHDHEAVLARASGERLCSFRDSEWMENASGVQALGVSPDGRSIAVAIGYETAAPRPKVKEEGAAVQVFDTRQDFAPVRGTVLWTTDRTCRKPHRVLQMADAEFGRLAWSNDGGQIVAMLFTAVAVLPMAQHRVIPRGDLVVIDMNIGTHRMLVRNIGGQPSPASLLEVSPSGDHVAFVYDPEGSPYPARRQLAVASLSSGQMRLISNEPRKGIGWLDSKTLWIVQTSGHRLMYTAKTLTLDGVERDLAGVPAHGVPSPDGRRVAWLESDLLGNSEISLASAQRAATDWKLGERRAIWKKRSMLERYARGERSLFQCESTNGVRPVALLVLPRDFQPGRRYPLIVDLHGGPRNGLDTSRLPYAAASVLNLSTLEHDMWAARGHAVLAPDYRASGLYGNDRIMRDGSQYERDLEDILCSVQSLVDRGIADETRMAVIGHSHGGAEVNWIITHSQRFKAAISKEGSSNVAAAVNWAARGQSNVILTALYGTPYDFPERYRRMSVMESIQNVTTPTMFVQHYGSKRPGDLYGWMFAVLKDRGIDTQLRLYEDPKHVLRRQPDRRDMLYAAISWIDERLRADVTLNSRPPP